LPVVVVVAVVVAVLLEVKVVAVLDLELVPTMVHYPLQGPALATVVLVVLVE
jgi:hypothetical protein